MKKSRLFAKVAVITAALVTAACSCCCPQQQPFNSQEIGRGAPKG